MWEYYNPNPSGRNVEDCAVRAVAKALDTDWNHAYAMIVANGYYMHNMPHSNSVWGDVLKKHHFVRETLPNSCPSCYTAEDFAIEHPRGTYVLGFGRHVATLKDGVIYDSWDSSKEIPEYFWHKKEE